MNGRNPQGSRLAALLLFPGKENRMPRKNKRKTQTTSTMTKDEKINTGSVNAGLGWANLKRKANVKKKKNPSGRGKAR